MRGFGRRAYHSQGTPRPLLGHVRSVRGDLLAPSARRGCIGRRAVFWAFRNWMLGVWAVFPGGVAGACRGAGAKEAAKCAIGSGPDRASACGVEVARGAVYG